MQKSDTYDDITRRLFDQSDELLARSQALTEQSIIQSALLETLNEWSVEVIKSSRKTIGELKEQNQESA